VISGDRGKQQPEQSIPSLETREDIYIYFREKYNIPKNQLKRILMIKKD
jgi:hypothetical protein